MVVRNLQTLNFSSRTTTRCHPRKLGCGRSTTTPARKTVAYQVNCCCPINIIPTPTTPLYRSTGSVVAITNVILTGDYVNVTPLSKFYFDTVARPSAIVAAYVSPPKLAALRAIMRSGSSTNNARAASGPVRSAYSSPTKKPRPNGGGGSAGSSMS